MCISRVLITLAVFSVASFTSCFSADQLYERCLSPLRCGSKPVFPNITYPFWGNDVDKPDYCGQSPFKLSCEDNQTLTIEIGNLTFRVISTKLESNLITVADESLFEGGCPKILNFTGYDRFTLNPSSEKIDLFDCSRGHPNGSLSTISCHNDSPKTYHVFRPSSSPGQGCEKIGEIPILVSAKNDLHQSNDSNQALMEALEQGFELSYNIKNQICQACTKSRGICGSESESQSFQCLCQDKPHKSFCDDQDAGLSSKATLGFKLASGLIVVILIAGSLFCVIIYKRKTSDDLIRQQKLKALIPLKHYSYARVKRITKSFAEVVGKGGFGTVYRGTLCDGRSVAVKILKDSKGNGEDFINEVASMSKTSHVNIVSLLGFCSEGSKRAIIYEFLEKGSLYQFISSNSSMNMDWMALYGIALGVARGLEYLHHGCKTRIVHFDIKPQNVLLDDNLCPKVSDFGLAKLCEKKDSILSLLDTRGTIGYIAPEVFSRIYGRVSDKSDVYSYGMLILEMIGARKKTSPENSASSTSTMYFPEWIYKDLENGDDQRLNRNEINNKEEDIAKKMTLVGLWCIQPSPQDRPAMNRVVEMMEGNLDALQIPPRPTLQIPSAPFQESSTLSEDISIYNEV